MVNKAVYTIRKELEKLKNISIEERVEVLNQIKDIIREISPFNEPVDVVKWVKSERVVANVYNPNVVAPPEMKLLELSIRQDRSFI